VDLVTIADKLSEKTLDEFFLRAAPSHGFLGEEGAMRVAAPGAPTWIVDPLDGTMNFAHGLPVFCVSVAAVVDGAPQVGVVHDPSRGEVFSAIRGVGAWMNGNTIAVSDRENLGEALLATGFPYDRRAQADRYLAYFKSYMCAAHGIRRMGAAALDLAWVAAGRVDGFWEFGLKPWDVAAGSLLVEAAGGVVSDLSGQPFALEGPSILAANARVHAEMLSGAAQIEGGPG
jgi:myo-inositol-1(or 4)-monophosphatase